MIAFTGHFYILFKEKGISVVPAEYFMKSRAFHRNNPPENRLISGIHTVYSDEPRLFDERFGRKSRLFEEREVFMMKKHILCTLCRGAVIAPVQLRRPGTGGFFFVVRTIRCSPVRIHFFKLGRYARRRLRYRPSAGCGNWG